MTKIGRWARNKRGLSPIFATVLLAVIVILCGSIAFYFSNNLTSTATNNYISTAANSQQSVGEGIAYEYIAYNPSPPILTVYIMNYGTSNGVQLNSVFLYNANHTIVGAYSGIQISALKPIDGGTPIPTNVGLNSGKEAYFTVTLNASLSTTSLYTFHLITQSGSTFDYEFVP